MKITLAGSRHFGVETFNMMRGHGIEVIRVVVADGEDRLAAAARAAGIEVVVQAKPKLIVASEIAPGTDLIVTAHSHALVSHDALKAAKHGGIGYHPSLLPRHRGIAAVEWPQMADLAPEPALEIEISRAGDEAGRFIEIENYGVRGFDPGALLEWEAGA